MASLLPGDSGVEKCEVTGGEGEGKNSSSTSSESRWSCQSFGRRKKNPQKIISKRNVIRRSGCDSPFFFFLYQKEKKSRFSYYIFFTVEIIIQERKRQKTRVSASKRKRKETKKKKKSWQTSCLADLAKWVHTANPLLVRFFVSRFYKPTIIVVVVFWLSHQKNDDPFCREGILWMGDVCAFCYCCRRGEFPCLVIVTQLIADHLKCQTLLFKSVRFPCH